MLVRRLENKLLWVPPWRGLDLSEQGSLQYKEQTWMGMVTGFNV